MCQQGFTATAGQTEFEVTEFTLTKYYMVSIDGILTSQEHYKSGNTIFFAAGLDEGTEVIIIN